MNLPKLVVDIKEVDKESLSLVGGKGANLGELAGAGFPVPPAFIVTSKAYFAFLEENKLEGRIAQELAHLDKDSPTSLAQVSQKIEGLIKKGELSQELKKLIFSSYKALGGSMKNSLVAVRSSATAEDLPEASFAGQQATFLNISGEANLVEAVRKCWASLFTPRAIFYREEHGFKHLKVGIAAIVQEMVQPEVSGVAFTVDPVTSDKHSMVIEAIWGLGEFIVQGKVTPDRYKIERHSLSILEKNVEAQTIQLIKQDGSTKQTKVPKSRRKRQKIEDKQIKTLAKILRDIHTHYYFPQDIEWAYKKGKFYIVQTRPVTTLGKKDKEDKKETKEETKGKPILSGMPASPGLVTGPVKLIKNSKQIGKVARGDVLVAEMTSPDFVPAMRRAVAIVTNEGGQTSHAAIVSRELGIPCVVGTGEATKVLEDGQVVTVDGAGGKVFLGKKPVAETKLAKPKEEPKQAALDIATKTKLYVNLAEPERAKEVAKLPVDGVGLLRAEFMIAEIGVHPRVMLKERKGEQFVERLASDLKTFCEAFNPRPVVYRTTDFKTNEYRNLRGGKAFEPEEPNPMLGFRGAFRYIADPDVFELELAAINRVREEGYKNLWLMLPFVRSPEELRQAKQIITSQGLVRGPTFKLWLMVELPVNVIMLESFIKVGIDGVSVGSNDLTMLILGTDRDNAEVASSFDERSPAVLWALKRVVDSCRRHGVTSSICGQAPSVYDDLVEALVTWGMTSISVNPDAISRVKEVIYQTERKLVSKKAGSFQ